MRFRCPTVDTTHAKLVRRPAQHRVSKSNAGGSSFYQVLRACQRLAGEDDLCIDADNKTTIVFDSDSPRSLTRLARRYHEKPLTQRLVSTRFPSGHTLFLPREFCTP